MVIWARAAIEPLRVFATLVCLGLLVQVFDIAMAVVDAFMVATPRNNISAHGFVLFGVLMEIVVVPVMALCVGP